MTDPARSLPDDMDDAMQRNDALRVIGLALASQGVPDVDPAALLRDIEEGGYTFRLTTHAERLAHNMEHQ